jgi:hypothetical protein
MFQQSIADALLHMDWLKLISPLMAEAQAQAQLGGFAGTRNALYCVWLTIQRAQGNVRDMFRAFDEDSLEQEAAKLDPADAFTGLPTSAATTIELERLLFALAVRVRVLLEREMLDLYDGAPLHSAANCIAYGGAEEAFILPRKPRNRTAKTGDAFHRRGLRGTRLIPRNIGAFAVELILPEDPRGSLRAAAGDPLVVGAGLFERLTLHVADVLGGFEVTDAAAPNQIEVIREQLLKATEARCAAVVYPELTIAEQALSAIRGSLSDGSWEVPYLSLLVPGSLHRKIAGRRYNVATVLDGYGNAIAEHRKLYRFSEGSTLREAIELGTQLQIVVLDDAIFAFGICLDFCNLSETPPYLTLDVDFVLVPSYGTENTMESHLKRSTDLIEKLKCKCVIVQQYHMPMDEHPLGYVLARTGPKEPTLAEVATKEPWKTCIV